MTTALERLRQTLGKECEQGLSVLSVAKTGNLKIFTLTREGALRRAED